MAIRLLKSLWNFDFHRGIPVHPEIHPIFSLLVFSFLFVFIRVIRGRICICILVALSVLDDFDDRLGLDDHLRFIEEMEALDEQFVARGVRYPER